jgi:tRNA-dihydrouridine synthase
MKLSLAPIQGSTNAFYRTLIDEMFGGFDTYYSPFIGTTDPLKASKVLFKDLYPENNKESISVVPQLLGNNGHDFNYYADQIVQMGYSEINWNIGCPFPTVTKKKKGSGILEFPEMIETFLDEVCKHKNYDLTIKMRLGLTEFDEGKKVMELLNNYPLKAVILHARTGDQKYEGVVNLEAFEEQYNLCQHELIYNGDIFTVEDFNRIQKRFPSIDEFMLGRGALRDPFLASEIKGTAYSNEEKRQMIKTFHDTVLNYSIEKLSGDKHITDRMKEFWSYLSYHMDPTGKNMKKIKKCKTVAAYTDTAEQLIKNNTMW